MTTLRKHYTWLSAFLLPCQDAFLGGCYMKREGHHFKNICVLLGGFAGINSLLGTSLSADNPTLLNYFLSIWKLSLVQCVPSHVLPKNFSCLSILQFTCWAS